MVPMSAYVLIWSVPVFVCVFSVFLYAVGGKWLDKD